MNDKVGKAVKALATAVNLLVGVVTEAQGVNRNALSIASGQLTTAQEMLHAIWPEESATQSEPMVAWR
jgi:hypothetical protein